MGRLVSAHLRQTTVLIFTKYQAHNGSSKIEIDQVTLEMENAFSFGQKFVFAEWSATKKVCQKS